VSTLINTLPKGTANLQKNKAVQNFFPKKIGGCFARRFMPDLQAL
jgi:hypothetical protein